MWCKGLISVVVVALLASTVAGQTRTLDQSHVKDAAVCTPQPACVVSQNLGFATVASTGGFGTFSHRSGASPSFRMGLGLGADGEIGQVEGFVVDPDGYRVTHVLLQEGHLWGRKEVAIPISAVTGVDAGIRVNLTKEQVGELPPAR